MKICCIPPAGLKSGQSDAYRALLSKTYSVCRDDTQIITRPLKGGLDRTSDFEYTYFWFLNKWALVESVIEAEREGCDAAVINSFSDAGVKEARSIVNIPVVSVSESSMMYATLLGSRFGIILPGGLPIMLRLLMEQINERGLESRAVAINPIRSLPMSTDELLTKGGKNPQLVAGAVEEVGRELVKDGADVIICGSTTFGPLCTATGFVQLEPEGVPILDCLAVTLKMAEVMVDFREKIGLPFISRGPTYKLPAEEDTKRIRALFGLSVAAETSFDN